MNNENNSQAINTNSSSNKYNLTVSEKQELKRVNKLSSFNSINNSEFDCNKIPFNTNYDKIVDLKLNVKNYNYTKHYNQYREYLQMKVKQEKEKAKSTSSVNNISNNIIDHSNYTKSCDDHESLQSIDNIEITENTNTKLNTMIKRLNNLSNNSKILNYKYNSTQTKNKYFNDHNISYPFIHTSTINSDVLDRLMRFINNLSDIYDIIQITNYRKSNSSNFYKSSTSLHPKDRDFLINIYNKSLFYLDASTRKDSFDYKIKQLEGEIVAKALDNRVFSHIVDFKLYFPIIVFIEIVSLNLSSEIIYLLTTLLNNVSELASYLTNNHYFINKLIVSMSNSTSLEISIKLLEAFAINSHDMIDLSFHRNEIFELYLKHQNTRFDTLLRIFTIFLYEKKIEIFNPNVEKSIEISVHNRNVILLCSLPEFIKKLMSFLLRKFKEIKSIAEMSYKMSIMEMRSDSINNRNGSLSNNNVNNNVNSNVNSNVNNYINSNALEQMIDDEIMNMSDHNNDNDNAIQDNLMSYLNENNNNDDSSSEMGNIDNSNNNNVASNNIQLNNPTESTSSYLINLFNTISNTMHSMNDNNTNTNNTNTNANKIDNNHPLQYSKEYSINNKVDNEDSINKLKQITINLEHIQRNNIMLFQNLRPKQRKKILQLNALETFEPNWEVLSLLNKESIKTKKDKVNIILKSIPVKNIFTSRFEQISNVMLMSQVEVLFLLSSILSSIKGREVQHKHVDKNLFNEVSEFFECMNWGNIYYVSELERQREQVMGSSSVHVNDNNSNNNNNNANELDNSFNDNVDNEEDLDSFAYHVHGCRCDKNVTSKIQLLRTIYFFLIKDSNSFGVKYECLTDEDVRSILLDNSYLSFYNVYFSEKIKESRIIKKTMDLEFDILLNNINSSTTNFHFYKDKLSNKNSLLTILSLGTVQASKVSKVSSSNTEENNNNSKTNKNADSTNLIYKPLNESYSKILNEVNPITQDLNIIDIELANLELSIKKLNQTKQLIFETPLTNSNITINQNQKEKCGLLNFLIVRYLLDCPYSPSKYWMAICIEIFLRGESNFFQYYILNSGLMINLIYDIIYSAKNHNSNNIRNKEEKLLGSSQFLQSIFDLLAEIVKFNKLAIFKLNYYFYDNDIERDIFFERITSISTLIDSNVFIRSILITLNEVVLEKKINKFNLLYKNKYFKNKANKLIKTKMYSDTENSYNNNNNNSIKNNNVFNLDLDEEEDLDIEFRKFLKKNNNINNNNNNNNDINHYKFNDTNNDDNFPTNQASIENQILLSLSKDSYKEFQETLLTSAIISDNDYNQVLLDSNLKSSFEDNCIFFEFFFKENGVLNENNSNLIKVFIDLIYPKIVNSNNICQTNISCLNSALMILIIKSTKYFESCVFSRLDIKSINGDIFSNSNDIANGSIDFNYDAFISFVNIEFIEYLNNNKINTFLNKVDENISEYNNTCMKGEKGNKGKKGKNSYDIWNNFYELLKIWMNYYNNVSRDIASLEYTSRIEINIWREVVALLLNNDSSNKSSIIYYVNKHKNTGHH